MPRPWIWLSCLVVSIAVSAAAFLALSEYSRKESVRGWLVSRDGVARISHSSSGTVDSIAAAPGDIIQAGEPVMYLSRDTFLQDGRSSGDEALLERRKQVAASKRQVQLLRVEAGVEQTSILTQLEILDEEQVAVSRQQQEQRDRLDAASSKLDRLRVAARGGAVTEWDVLRQEDEWVGLNQALSRLQQAETELHRERERLGARARSLPAETERSVLSLNSQRSELQLLINEHETARHVVLKSPISGRLASVEVHEGATVTPNQLLATVLPQNLTLVAEVFVPSSAIGFIRRGQSVRLKYDAFPQQQFGAFAGKVDRISDFVLLPSEVPQTFFLREATFKVRITIESNSIALEAGSARLRPGMLLAAEIILENRTLIDWLLEPIRRRRRDAA